MIRTIPGLCVIRYRDIGDYLSRDEKLCILNGGSLHSTEWQTVTPNTFGDWVNQRNDQFLGWPVIGDKAGGPRVFVSHSLGLATNRDAWVYNYSRDAVEANVRSMIDFYNSQVDDFAEFCAQQHVTDRKAHLESFIEADTKLISWSARLRSDLAAGKRLTFDPKAIVDGSYRPFSRQRVYFNKSINERTNQLPAMFPTAHHSNEGFYVVGAGSDVPFSAIMLDLLPNLHVTGAGSGGQFFPRWTYEKAESDDDTFDFGPDDVDEYGYRKIDNITDDILALYREAIGDQVTKDEIFYYVYGVLHDPAYREKYAADLKKMLPHIPTPETRERFDQFADAGRKLADLHVNYESVQPYSLDVQLKPGADPGNRETWRVQKMKWRSKTDHSAIVYNGKVTISGIPEEVERYMLGSRSALAWIIDRYQVTTDKASGIVNDPNDWCDEHDDPTYIVALIKRVTTVSVETMKIVDSLSESPK